MLSPLDTEQGVLAKCKTQQRAECAKLIDFRTFEYSKGRRRCPGNVLEHVFRMRRGSCGGDAHLVRGQ